VGVVDQPGEQQLLVVGHGLGGLLQMFNIYLLR